MATTYYIDKRIFVTGKKSVMFMDDPFNLTAYIVELIDSFGVTCAQNGTNIQSSLSALGTQINCVELGGTLLHDTVVSGAAFDLFWLNYGQFFVTGEELSFVATDSWGGGSDVLTVLSSQETLRLSGLTRLELKTPIQNTSPGSLVNGYVLTLTDAGTGLCEWQAASGGGGLLNVGLGLTESPVGTVKLGGIGIGSGEDLAVANGGLWQVTDPLSMADTVNGIGIGTLPIGPAACLLTNITNGNFSAISTTGDGTNGYATMYQQIGPDFKSIRLSGSDIEIVNSTVATMAEVTVDTDGLVLDARHNVTGDVTTIRIVEGDGIVFEGDFSSAVYSYEFPKDNATPNQILVNDGAGVITWEDQPVIPPPVTVAPRYVQTFVAGTSVGGWNAPGSSAIISGASDLVILAATHGRGTDPIVQVCIDDVPAIGICAVVNTLTNDTSQEIFGAISIDPITGDVTLTDFPAPGPAPQPSGKVIIM